MGYEVSFCQEMKSWPSTFHLFGSLIKVENTWKNVPHGNLYVFCCKYFWSRTAPN